MVLMNKDDMRRHPCASKTREHVYCKKDWNSGHEYGSFSFLESQIDECLQEAQQVVLAAKPAIKEASLQLDPELRDELLKHLSTLAAVYHKLPHSFTKIQRVAVQRADELEEAARKREEEEADEGLVTGDASTVAGVGEAGDGSEAAGVSGAAASGASALEGSSGTVSSATVPPVDLLGGMDEANVRSCLCKLNRVLATRGNDRVCIGLDVRRY
jgi:hypothetical protein